MTTFTDRLALIISADSQGAVRELERVGQSAERNLGRAESRADRFSSRALYMGGALLTASAVAGAGLLSVAQKASDVGESVNKVEVLFGKSGKAAVAWSENLADSLGLSKGEALEAAGAFGSMFRTTGLAQDRAASMSQTMVELAADMASFNNEDPSEMLDKLRSGLAGEAEPLRRFGVLLSEASVQAFAYKSGIAETGQQLTEAQKVQARYGLILEQTKLQQGDFGRTSDGAANAQRRLEAQVENLQAALGQGLVPALSGAVNVGNDVVGMVSDLNAESGGLVGQLGGVVTAGAAVSGVLLLGAAGAIKLGSAVSSGASALASGVTWLTSYGVAAAGTTVEVTALTAANLRLAASGGASFGASITSASMYGTTLARVASSSALAAGGLVLLGPALDMIGLGAETSSDRFDRHVAAQERMITASKRSSASVRAEMQVVEQRIDAQKRLIRSMDPEDAGDMLGNFFRTEQSEHEKSYSRLNALTERHAALKRALGQTADGLGQTARKQSEFNQQVSQAAAPVQTLQTALQSLVNSQLGYEGALRSQADAETAAAEAKKAAADAGGRNVELNKAAADAEFRLKQAIDATASAAAQRAADQLGPNATAEDKAKANLDAYRSSLMDAARSSIPAVRAQALLLLAQLQQVEGNWNATVGVDAAQAKVTLDGLEGRLKVLRTTRTDHNVYVAITGPGASRFRYESNIPQPKQAAGGVVPGFAGGGVARPVTVGERGWETAFLPVGTRVVSHEESLAALERGARGRGDSRPIHLEVNIDARGSTMTEARMRSIVDDAVGGQVQAQLRELVAIAESG
jgi:hypothetical protein